MAGAGGLDLMKLFALREQFGAAAKKGEVLFSPGQPADTFYVLLRGRVQLDRAGWEPEILGPGDLVGEVDVFAARPRTAQASALDDTGLLAFTRESASALAEATPSFALVVVRKSCERVATMESLVVSGATPPAAPGANGASHAAAPANGAANGSLPASGGAASAPPANGSSASVAAPASSAVAVADPPSAAEAEASASGETIGPVLTVDYAASLWKKDVKCPNCRVTFHAWNVRSQAINVSDRDSDFMSHYVGVDPNYYAVWVCPACNLAAYADDFAALQSVQVGRIKPLLEEVKKADPRHFDFTYYRDHDLALRSYQLALAAYDGQRTGAEKVAGLYHRMAWVERARGSDDEQLFLDKAREAYEKAFATSDAAKQGVLWAYLIAELDMRLGKYTDAIKWFGTAAQQPDFKSQPLLEKMVRDRWSEAGALAKTAKEG